MKRIAMLAAAAALLAAPALAAEQQPAGDNAPGSQTQEMQGKVGNPADEKAKAERPESRGASGDSYPTTSTTGSAGSSAGQPNATPPQQRGDTPRDGTTK